MAYKSLSTEEQARIDPMITGFNPADMYAADHIRRVLKTFPGVFSGIGEFTIHKEFVSAKIAGEPASLTDPALDRIFDFAGEVGLVVHPPQRRRRAVPQAGPGAVPGHPAQGSVPAAPQDHDHLGARRRRPHRAAGQGPARDHRRGYSPIRAHACLRRHLVGRGGQVHRRQSGGDQARQPTLINKYPDRFLFGTDEVAPTSQEKYLKVYDIYAPLFAELTRRRAWQLRKGNYERLFDKARRKVRAWEKANAQH